MRLLADRVHAREDLLRRGDGRVVDVADQLVGGRPGLVVGLAHDDVQADAEAQLAAALAPPPARTSAIFSATVRRRLAPGQVDVDLLGGDVDAGRATSRRNRAADSGFCTGGKSSLPPSTRRCLPSKSTVSPASSARQIAQELAR